jgi:hypothetical protein
VLVPHEDHADASVPLFNIRAAAVGVENGWARNDSAAEALALLEINPQLLVGEFLQSDTRSKRSGFLDALQLAKPSDLQAIQTATVDQLNDSPELTPLLAATAAITADPEATRRLLIDGRGTGLATALKSLVARQNTADQAALLKLAIEQAPTDNAALAIAAWWPALRHDAATRQLLMDKLGDDALGSPAALALAQNPDIQTIRELQQIAEGDSPAAGRARLALNINRDLLTREVEK